MPPPGTFREETQDTYTWYFEDLEEEDVEANIFASNMFYKL